MWDYNSVLTRASEMQLIFSVGMIVSSCEDSLRLLVQWEVHVVGHYSSR